jgi:hypothetical protein
MGERTVYPLITEKLITETELIDRLNISRRHCITLRNMRLIPHIRLKRAVRYYWPDVQKALERLTVKEIGSNDSRP